MDLDNDDTPGLDKFGRFANRRELDLVKPMLEPGERILHALEAYNGPRKGLLVATDHRVLWATAGLIRDQVQQWAYPQLHRVQVALDAHDAVISMEAEGQALVFAKAQRKAAEAFARSVRDRPEPSTYRKVRPVDDPAHADADAELPLTEAEERLARLDRMVERGSMSEPEYRVARRRILEHNDIPVRRPGSTPRPAGTPVPLGAPGAGDAEPGTEVLRAADLPEGTDPLGGYKWSDTQGITTKAPVQSSEDPSKVFETPARSDWDAAARRVDLGAEPTSVKPVPSAKKAPVTAEPDWAPAGPVRSANRPPTTQEPEPPRFERIQSANKGPTQAEPESPSLKPIPSAKKGPVEVEGDPLKEALEKQKAKKDEDAAKRPRVWPPLPGKD